MTATRKSSLPHSSTPQGNDRFWRRGRAMSPFLYLFLPLILFFTSCTNTDDTRLPGYLYLRLNSNPTTLDPALITDVMGGGIAAKLFNGLVRFNENLDIVPDLARSWTLSPDQRTYTFHLRSD